jgi:hypothetical protein
MSRSIGSIAPALSLVLLLSAGAAQALPRPAQAAPSQPAGVLDAAWEWLVELFAPVPAQDAAAEIRDKAGWELDPNGLRLLSTPGAPQTLAIQQGGCTTTDHQTCS